MQGLGGTGVGAFSLEHSKNHAQHMQGIWGLELHCETAADAKDRNSGPLAYK